MRCTPLVTDIMATGNAHHAGGRFARAVECYSEVLATLPEHGEAWRLLGVVASQTGDTQSARSLLERALRIDAGDAGAYSALGNVNESDLDDTIGPNKPGAESLGIRFSMTARVSHRPAR